jgi:hypothetical protein
LLVWAGGGVAVTLCAIAGLPAGAQIVVSDTTGFAGAPKVSVR